MKRTKDYTLLALFIPFALACLFEIGIGCEAKKEQPVKPEIGHTCKWELCPYKGVKEADRKTAVLTYTECLEGSDGYCIDMLHLEYPTLEYDQLDSLLFTPIK